MTRVQLHEPFGFADFVRLESTARLVVTDSGTVQEECSLLKVPTVTCRDTTERPETVECGSNVLSGVSDPARMLECARAMLAARAGLGLAVRGPAAPRRGREGRQVPDRQRRPVVSAPVSVGVVGLGYWGPNLARNFAALPESELTWICDGSEEQLAQVAPRFPGVRTTTSLDDLLTDPTARCGRDRDAVPDPRRARRSCPWRRQALLRGEAAAQSVADAEAVADAARASGRTLMVGHLLEYHPGLERLKQLVDGGELGDIQYIYGNRLNLGKLRADENALWSLGAHDVSVVLRLAGEEPVECHAHGESYMREGVEDVVFCYLRFPSGLAAHLHLSWLDPHKERRFTVVGSRRMATFDDMAVEQKLTVYDKGFDQRSEDYREYVQRSGDVWSPQVPVDEPLRIECSHFVERVLDGEAPRSDAAAGVRVVRVLEDLQRSLATATVSPQSL